MLILVFCDVFIYRGYYKSLETIQRILSKLAQQNLSIGCLQGQTELNGRG